MKKVFYFFLLLLLPFSVIAGEWQDGSVDPEKVEMNETLNKEHADPRSISNVPTVWLMSGEDSYLSARFNCGGNVFSVIVKNELDQTVYTGDLLADGTVFEYNVSFLSGGNYTLIIKNGTKEYKGVFTIW